MRSGTTSLARYLGEHPQVYMCANKEPHFFDRDFDKGLDWYMSLFSRATVQMAAGEATQTYMYDEIALARLAATLPEARLIAILRNPIDRAYSHYWHRRARGAESLGFGEALLAEPERIRSDQPYARAHYSYLDRGRYVAQLQHVCEYYPRESLHVMLFEDLRDRPQDTFQALCRFLGVDGTFHPPLLGQSINSYITFRSVRVRAWSKRLPDPARRLVGALNTRAERYPPMDPALRQQLRRYFARDNVALADWLPRDLRVWDQ